MVGSGLLFHVPDVVGDDGSDDVAFGQPVDPAARESESTTGRWWRWLHGTVVFAIGYLLVWTSFSAVATLLQWGLEQLAVLSPMMASTSSLLGAGLLLAAGIYQLTPFKNACLRHCRSPVHSLMQHWRRGTSGAFMMGFHHGVYCIGCCWLLMTLLFVFGVMNLVWIAVLSVFVLLEKVVPRGELVARVAGVGFIVAGVSVLFGTV